MARSARELTVWGPGSLIQFAPGQDAIGFPVLGTSGLDDFRRKFRAGRGFRPVHSLEIVANKLLVERGLRTARVVLGSGPKARRIGREGFVDPDQVIGRGTAVCAMIKNAELEFRVGLDLPARLDESCRAAGRFQADAADLLGKFLAD